MTITPDATISIASKPQTTAPDRLGPFRPKRAIVAAILVILALLPSELGDLTRSLMTDAFVQVSVFVAATLLIFYGAERIFRFDIGQSLKSARGFQVPLAALLGATPGCGGAVVVVAAYSSGNVGFGAVVATLTATMGDAAFLLIATRPDAAARRPAAVLRGRHRLRLDRRPVQPDRHDPAFDRQLRVRAADRAHTARATSAISSPAAPGLIVGGAQFAQVRHDSAGWHPGAVDRARGHGDRPVIWSTSQLSGDDQHQRHPRHPHGRGNLLHLGLGDRRLSGL